MSRKTLVGIGLSANDHTGDTPRVGAIKINALRSGTYVATAQQFGGTTKEATYTNTIAAAVADGIGLVEIPIYYDLDGSAGLPYDASLVTFNGAVRVAKEGGDASQYDLAAYGFAGDGSSSDTAALAAYYVGSSANTGSTLPTGTAFASPNNIVGTPWRGYTATRYAAMDADSNQGTTFRGRVAGGTPGAPSATPAGNIVAFSGHTTTDGVTYSGQVEMVYAATELHDVTHRGTQIIFSTTATGQTTRTGRWIIDGSANFRPFVDDTYDLGSEAAAQRVRAGYFSQKVKVGLDTAAGQIQINGPAGGTRDLIFLTASSKRWHIRADTAAEGGANAGSNFQVEAYDDSGTKIDDPLIINRVAGGNVTVASGRPLSLVGTGGVLLINSVGVVRQRRTGWTAWTGTAVRTTQNADAPPSATQIAQALKALIDDLIAHGLIGT